MRVFRPQQSWALRCSSRPLFGDQVALTKTTTEANDLNFFPTTDD